MEPRRFDELVKDVVGEHSRRGILRVALAGLTAGALGALGLGETKAAFRCRDIGRICRKNADCCGTCAPKDRTGRRRSGCPPQAEVCGSTCCDESEYCHGGACCLLSKACGEGSTCCGPAETCIAGDCWPRSRACGESCCDAGVPCVDGVCQPPCQSPTECPGPNALCCDGVCTTGQCCDALDCQQSSDSQVGEVECCGHQCVFLGTVRNCGARGDACAPGFACCNGTCVDLDSDDTNCGCCGNICGSYGAAACACAGGLCQAGVQVCSNPCNFG